MTERDWFRTTRDARAEALRGLIAERTMTPEFIAVRSRAPRMSPEQRRDAIIDAVIPLLREHGRELSTRQIADAADVAEGTLFRVFEDKDSIIEAAIDRVLDPLPLRTRLRAIDRGQSVEGRIADVLSALRGRFAEVGSFMGAMHLHGTPPERFRPPPMPSGEWLDIVRELFAGDEHRLAVPVDELAYYLRLVAFASAIPPLNVSHRFTDDELIRLVAHGTVK